MKLWSLPKMRYDNNDETNDNDDNNDNNNHNHNKNNNNSNENNNSSSSSSSSNHMKNNFWKNIANKESKIIRYKKKNDYCYMWPS